MSSPTEVVVPHIMVVVGEPSGDALGAELMSALKERTGGKVNITGVGGLAMEAEGLRTLFPLDDTAVMGLREVVPAIPRIFKRIREAADHAEETRPDAVVLIDAPDFTHRIGRRLKKTAPDLTIIKYVAPQVWASRPGRAKSLGSFIDHQLACYLMGSAFSCYSALTGIYSSSVFPDNYKINILGALSLKGAIDSWI